MRAFTLDLWGKSRQSTTVRKKIGGTGNTIPHIVVSSTTPLPIPVSRRSFFCGEVLRYQFNYPDTRKFNNCEITPTFRGRDKQRKC